MIQRCTSVACFVSATECLAWFSLIVVFATLFFTILQDCYSLAK